MDHAELAIDVQALGGAVPFQPGRAVRGLCVATYHSLHLLGGLVQIVNVI